MSSRESLTPQLPQDHDRKQDAKLPTKLLICICMTFNNLAACCYSFFSIYFLSFFRYVYFFPSFVMLSCSRGRLRDQVKGRKEKWVVLPHLKEGLRGFF